MKTRAINPTPWLRHFNMNHAIEVTGASRTLYFSGQTSTNADGGPLHPGDLVGQFQTAWGNLKDVLSEADMQPTHIIRMNVYTTDVAQFMEKAEDIIPIFAADGVEPVCTLLGVSALFDPDLIVEIEATAAA
ncbi:MAG: RidA family protein [Litorimonas sp.]